MAPRPSRKARYSPSGDQTSPERDRPPGNDPSETTSLPSETRNMRSGSTGKNCLNAPEPGSTIKPFGYVHQEPPVVDPTAIIARSALNTRAPSPTTSIRGE